MESYVLGVDGGTESLRAHLFNLQGQSLGSSACPYKTHLGAGGVAEQDPEAWWQAIGKAVRALLGEVGISAHQVIGLALATTCCTVVALDAENRPLRPAILWMDVRAKAEAADMLVTADPALITSGAGHGPVSAECMIPKALWLARHEPETFTKAYTICEYQDFMALRLTGRRAASLSNAAIRWHYANDRGGIPRTLLQSLGLSALIHKWPDEFVAPGKPLGQLTEMAALHLGLTTRTLVVQGGVDALVGMVGLGVAKPGQIALITGSSHLQFGVGKNPVHAKGLWGSYQDAVYPGRSIIEGGQTSTGSIVAWFRQLTGADLATLNREASRLPPGAEGLLALDHFQGNRTPYTDPVSRGAFVGLSLHHGKAHLFRAILEAVGFGTRMILDRMAEAGFMATEMTLGGGVVQSDLWLQIHADTAGLPIIVPETPAAPALGAAILAATGTGQFNTIDDGIDAMVRPGRRIEPDAARVALYEPIFQRYAALYPALKPFFNEKEIFNG